MKTAYKPMVKIKCGADSCKSSDVFGGYSDAELAGWSWSEKKGWRCDRCEFTRITQPIVTQAALI